MKALVLILILIQAYQVQASSCKGVNEPAIAELIALSEEWESLVNNNGAGYKEVISLPIEKQAEASGAMMKPLDPNHVKYSKDYLTVGKVSLQNGEGTEIGYMTGFKVSDSCIITAAHGLYNQTHPQIATRNQYGKFNYRNKVTFTRTHNGKSQTLDTEILFQMTQEGKDFERDEQGIPHFRGHSDLVVLKLKSGNTTYKDSFAKKLKVVSPEQIHGQASKSDVQTFGKQIRCIGLPEYKTKETYGSCKGTDFLWHQEHARVFENRESAEVARNFGMATNAATGPGATGGACELQGTDEVIGVPVNGYFGRKTIKMPNVQFRKGYDEGDARNIALLHDLDQRMKRELGQGLEGLNELCK